jgi:DNA-binding transcriptional LysR family regulator
MDHGELDVVIGGRCDGGRPGQVLWREPLVWAGAEWCSLMHGAPVPLALFPEPCPYREAALAALARGGVEYRIALVGSSVAGLRAAAQAGFAVTPDAGLPVLPDVEFTMFASGASSPKIADELAGAIVEAFAHKAEAIEARRPRAATSAATISE